MKKSLVKATKGTFLYSWAEFAMGQVCNGPRLLWTEFVMGRDVPEPGVSIDMIDKSTFNIYCEAWTTWHTKWLNQCVNLPERTQIFPVGN